ncbi:kinase-like domain-containing protein [Absidia repens]|uniref:Kinase-like domain-containing protein n=1 Tax=Absidia repens TaxID=90262 RepID=A0A1X2IJ11_9FUNG|nr:kinase-like domain-containing protein [Absidia repens]
MLVSRQADKKRSSSGSALAISVFNVIIEDKQRNWSLVRYIKDFVEFDQKVKKCYKKCKLALPVLTEPQLQLHHKHSSKLKYKYTNNSDIKRRGVRGFLLGLSSLKYYHQQRSNSEKVETYLRQCAADPFISRSSLFRDFLSAQRDEDRVTPLIVVRSMVQQHQQQQQQQHHHDPYQDRTLLHDSILPDAQPLDMMITDESGISNQRNFDLADIDRNIKPPVNGGDDRPAINILPMENPHASPASSNSSLFSLRRMSSWINMDRQRRRRFAGSGTIGGIQRRNSVTSLSSVSSISSLHSVARSESHVYYHQQQQQQQQQQHQQEYGHDSDNSGSNNMMDDMDGIMDSSSPSTDFSNHSPGRITIQDFQFIKVLGKGCMGKVLLVRHQRTNQLLALKAIRKEVVIAQSEVVHARMERDILTTIAKIQHPFLIKLHHAFQDANQLFLVLDYFVGGDMANQLAKFQRFTPDRSRLYTAEILLGLQELHRLGILYRDLKPENILLAADGHIILTDFGLSKQFGPGTSVEDQRTSTFCGTAEYISPETLQGHEYTYAVDFWSLGTILYEMLMGLPPFWAETHADMYRRVLYDPLEFPEDMDPVTSDFIAGLLQRNPLDRLGTGVDGPITIRSHPYFSCLEWTDVYYRRIRPPYVPRLRSETDFSHFDQDFLAMTPRLSPTTRMTHPNTSSNFSGNHHVDPSLLDLTFQGYSYTNTDSNYMDDAFPSPSATTSDLHQSSIYYYDDDQDDDDIEGDSIDMAVDRQIQQRVHTTFTPTTTDEESSNMKETTLSSSSGITTSGIF